MLKLESISRFRFKYVAIEPKFKRDHSCWCSVLNVASMVCITVSVLTVSTFNSVIGCTTLAAARVF